MLAIWLDWAGDGARLSSRIANSLGLFAGQPSNYVEVGHVAFAQLTGPRGRSQRGWRPVQGASGLKVLFHGALDNAAEIAAELGLAPQTAPAELYLAALQQWGDATDLRCVGAYCSIAYNAKDETLRLARSPYDAPPLHFYYDGGQAIAASVPRVIFAAGVRQQLDRRRVIQDLVYHTEQASAWYVGLHRVPLGTIAVLDRSGHRFDRFYDPAVFARVKHPHADAPEQAFELLRQSAEAVHRSFARPGLLLSGGLDSPLVATALLEALPSDQKLPTFTFTPCAEWGGELAPGTMGDERPLVESLARMHPRLQPQFFPNEGVEFDHRWPDLFLACGGAGAGLPNLYMYHALWGAAVKAGCDGITCADFGNLSYSAKAYWACAEFLRTGRWGQLAKSLVERRYDPRNLLKRFIALAVLPNVPSRLRPLIASLRGNPRSAMLRHWSAINPRLLETHEARDTNGKLLDPITSAPADHTEFVDGWLAGEGEANDIAQGFEQLYGLPRRDATAYRPLIEFCLSLPTREFEWDGESRRLARRMGKGRVPAAISANPLYGRHGVDWHARMAPRRKQMIAELRAYRNDPFLSELLDLDRAIHALEAWPERTNLADEVQGPLVGIAVRAALTARFINFVEGRNAL